LCRGVRINGIPFTPIPGRKNRISGPLMNAKVEKKINGLSVSASPIFKGGVLPAYWTCSINDHMIPKIFKSAKEVFRFVKNFKRY
jgi:hypothetical protein